MSHFTCVALCGLQRSNLRLYKRIRIGITTFKTLIWVESEESTNHILFRLGTAAAYMLECKYRVKSSKFGHQVNSDTHLQTVDIQMRRLLMSRLIRIFTVCLHVVNLFLIPITEL